MHDEIKALWVAGFKGDDSAVEKLFSIAEALKSEGKLAEASYVLSEAESVSALIARHNAALERSAKAVIQRKEKFEEMHQRWREKNPNGMRELPYCAPTLEFGLLQRLVWELEDSDDPEIREVLSYLSGALLSLDRKEYSPPDSMGRPPLKLLAIVFGLGDKFKSTHGKALEHENVRICVDFLADILMEKLSHSSCDSL